MKKIKTIMEVRGEGLTALIGKRVMLWCINYIYEGDLVGVDDHDVLLENAGVVYQTGELTAAQRKDYQQLGRPLYVRTQAIESYMQVELVCS